MADFNYKMICSDIDGTLLNAERTISGKNKDILCHLAEKLKIPVVLVSARMPKGMRYLQDLLKINQPIICYNGALVEGERDERGNAPIWINKTIPVALLSAIYEKGKSLHLHMGFYRYDDWFVEEMDEGAEKEMHVTKATPDVTSLQNVIGKWESEKEGPHKVMLIGTVIEIERMEEFLLNNFSSHIHIYRSKSTYLELNVKTVSKASAICLLQEKYKVKTEEIIAFGDNYNDIEMIRYAGLGVAMGNAPDAVKDIADEITLSNLEDGMAATLNRYLFSV